MPAAVTETIDVDATPETAFFYVADFAHLDEWDPMFDQAERLDPDEPLGEGARFRVVAEVANREVTIDYRIATWDPPHRVVLVGTAESFVSTDDIRFAPHDAGTRITYHAEVDSDAPDWVDAAATPLFKVVGKRTASGLRDRLGS
ncbi:SRPBCC family protein [Salsipaludibacter albus]|uniref:SRPBCC family protein n=1 Tax=Salsipaludibacter albus TaxID=2849650 RepID=UPI001EE403B9|nr:SRPBCC family protein [Salsipaludibacter albus]MBY5162470.1 SRPBCC family protein [Salsipaludibacter albus]